MNYAFSIWYSYHCRFDFIVWATANDHHYHYGLVVWGAVSYHNLCSPFWFAFFHCRFDFVVWPTANDHHYHYGLVVWGAVSYHNLCSPFWFAFFHCRFDFVVWPTANDHHYHYGLVVWGAVSYHNLCSPFWFAFFHCRFDFVVWPTANDHHYHYGLVVWGAVSYHNLCSPFWFAFFHCRFDFVVWPTANDHHYHYGLVVWGAVSYHNLCSPWVYILHLPSSTAVSTSLFGPPPMTTTTTTASLFGPPPMTTTTTTASLFGAPSAITTSAPLFGLPSSTATFSAAAAPRMNFKDLQQTLLKLRVDFERQEKYFMGELDDLNAFDIVLRRAQDKVFSLGQDIDELEQERERFVCELDILSQQQTELDALITQMEKTMGLSPLDQQQLSGQPSVVIRDMANATPADLQRQNILQLQMTVNAQMKQLDDELGDLCEQITDLQRLSGDSLSGDDLKEHEHHRSMLDQIHQILRSQLDTLVWVDKQSAILMDRVNRATSDVLTLR
ncbi:hypothetical protein niasHS_013577 [Heterodera schachtii]|uniref:Nucleoporin NSP1-like C-terminal domain-containing protein n=1 Tax=Heterodera schachtii TaxID=97005 RepID=A0ABD2IAY9_HETSC